MPWSMPSRFGRHKLLYVRSGHAASLHTMNRVIVGSLPATEEHMAVAWRLGQGVSLDLTGRPDAGQAAWTGQ
jgi:hypothetical protein